jgi:hypothetical protein
MIVCEECGYVNPIGTKDNWSHACGEEIEVEDEED